MHYLFDSHVHSHHSHDGHSSVEQLALQAKAQGLAGFCVTDHYDGNLWHTRDFFNQQAASAAEFLIAKEQYNDSLTMRFGVEIGEIFYDIEKTEELILQQPYDMVLLSVHKLKGKEDFYYVDFSSMSTEECDVWIQEYFEVLRQGVCWGGADVLAHLTLLQRYFIRCGLRIDFTLYQEIIDDILQKVVDKGMGIEINTSGLRRKENIFMPELWILQRYHALGGEIVTVGSDSHRAQEIGSHLLEGMKLLEQAGFRYFAVYKEREPKFFLLD